MKKSYSVTVKADGHEINQFASISSDGQVLLWEKKFQDAQKKPITDVNIDLFSYPRSHGKLVMDFICLGLKVEVKWAVLLLLLRKIRKEQSLLAHQTKEICLYVIGQHDLQTRLVAKTKLLLDFGTTKGVIDLVLLWIYYPQTKTLS